MVDRLTIVFFICNLLNGFFHYLFNLAVSRLLGLGEVGTIFTLLNLMVLMTIPLAALQNVVTQSVATWTAQGQFGLIRKLWNQMARDALILGLFLAAGIFLGAGRLQSFYKLPSPVPIWVMATIPLPMVLLPTLRGVLQGSHAFLALGINLVVEGFGRFGTGVLLVLLGTGAAGGLAASTLSGLLALGIGYFVMVKLFDRTPPSDSSVSLDIFKVYRMAGPMLLAQFGLSAMAFMDLPIIKPRFSAVDVGLYAGVEFCGKAVFFMPIPLTGLMFAKVAALEAKGLPTRPTIWRTLLMAGAICGGMVAVFAAAPEWVITKAIGAKFIPAAPMLVPFGVAMAGFALTYALVSYHLSRGRTGFLSVFVGLTVLQGVALALIPNSVVQTVWVLCTCALIHLAVQLVVTFRGQEVPPSVTA